MGHVDNGDFLVLVAFGGVDYLEVRFSLVAYLGLNRWEVTGVGGGSVLGGRLTAASASAGSGAVGAPVVGLGAVAAAARSLPGAETRGGQYHAGRSGSRVTFDVALCAPQPGTGETQLTHCVATDGDRGGDGDFLRTGE